jgi:DNA mismatch repair ATPase MutS
VRSLIGRSDDLSAGKSYYQVEAEGVVDLLRRSRTDPPTLFLLDELLRGTNTIERLAAGEAVLRALLEDSHDGVRHTVVVATHDGELVSLLADCYEPWHFRESIGPEGLSFEYRRLPGPATTRTALALLEASGAPAAMLDLARVRAAELDARAAANRAQATGSPATGPA